MAPDRAHCEPTRPFAPGDVVYLLVELGTPARGSVHEIGSRARVLSSEGSRLTLAVGEGASVDVVSCFTSQVQPARAGVRRRQPLRWRRARDLANAA